MDKFKKNFLDFKTFTTKRNVFFIAYTFIALVVPFLNVDGRRVFMMSFLHKRLEFMGTVFDASQLYVLPLFIFMFAAWVLMWTALGGRVWCGWGCPQTILRVVFRDLLQGAILKLRVRKDKNRPLKLNTISKYLRYYLSLLIWSGLALVVSANLSWYFIDPPEWFSIIASGDFAQYPFVFSLWLGLSGFLILDIAFVGENFCKYICPYARIQAVFFDEETALVVYDEKRGNNTDGSQGIKNFARFIDKSGDCTDCLACVKVCPTGIDIRNGLQLGCIECLECVDACEPVMARKGVPNLIAWTTYRAMDGEKSRFVRPRTVSYAAIALICFVLVFVVKELKKDISLNLNHGAGTYQVDDGLVENSYFLLITNRTTKEKTFRVALKSPYELDIIRPKRDITLPADSVLKKALILQIPASKLVETDGKLFKFTVEIYDLDDPITPIDEIGGKFFTPSQE
ncbi:MAG: cytochrome c oxidase accessory protein CcoG [SAR324 cluster bacterium]|nr:cytochrome c oxidase accessory protein CcoG [SAR324 cluster bacterium]